MLTKDLLQATVRNGKLYPKFIEAQDPQVMADVKSLMESFSQASGRQMGELEDDIKAFPTRHCGGIGPDMRKEGP